MANVIGTDLSNYKVIRREQFACSLMQVSRDGKMPVAISKLSELQSLLLAKMGNLKQ